MLPNNLKPVPASNNLHPVVLATSNAGKLQEFSALLINQPIRLIPQSYFGIEAVEENGLSFLENAILKARYASKHTGLPAMADDSGLVVDALNDAPGIFSARYAGLGATDEENRQKLLNDLIADSMEERAARFYCVIVYLRDANDPMPIIGQGVWEGSILLEPKGENGFGYDSIFYVPTHNCSAAELSSEIKNKISHRAQAFTELVKRLQHQW